ncbi:HAMP domain-containing sensor histidine kinase [Eubacteriaceae bacterium ES3]|nr:HAMP domain-containing sensor histidine kinase [Eubacteriaceae bacterium ES3]
METKVHTIVTMYNENGVTDELESLIKTYDEEGMVVEMIQQTTDSYLQSPESILVADASEDIFSGIEMLQAQTHGNQSGNGNHDGEAEESSSGSGSGSGAGDGTGPGSGDGTGTGTTTSPGYDNGLHIHQTFEEQVSEYESGESFITILETENQQVEWLTYMETTRDGIQVTGRIPLYSIHEVIDVVSDFLLFFFLIVFVLLLIFSFFFARGISKPIIELKNIAKSMGDLQFDNKYTGKRKDEVGQLGETLNHISDELESSIEHLRVELNKERTMDKMRKRFTAYVSHEIQTPLAIIKSYAEALEDEIPQNHEEEIEYFQLIQKETDKISGIASDLLDLSQMEAGVYQIKKVETNIDTFLNNSIKPFRIAESDIKFELKNTATGTADLDYNRMEQVFKNIVGNAIKHLEPPNGRIRIESQIIDQKWHLSVYNDGKPIPEEEIQDIFEYFYTAQSGKKGTGLGLAIVKGIVTCHGGTVSARNEGEGVLFQVEIPLV